MPLYLAILLVISGCIILAWSADRFTLGAARVARHFNVSPLLIGMVVVGFSTSLPEMIVSGVAAFQGDSIVGVGNAIGSNITNIALVLGVAALISPLSVHSSLLRGEFVILLVITFFVVLMLSNYYLSRLNGIILLLGFILLFIWLIKQVLKMTTDDEALTQFKAEIKASKSMFTALLWLIIGGVLLLVSSKMLVKGAVAIATYFGMSELVIGLTILAIGTSLPELATAVASSVKKEYAMAIGNVLGSSMFNLLAVLAMPALIYPTTLPSPLLYRDLPVMVLLIFMLFVMAYGFKGKAGKVNRIEGGLLVISYFAYLGWLLISHQSKVN